MDSDLRSIAETIVYEHNKKDWVAIVKHINDHIRKCENSVKSLREHLKQRGVPEKYIECECAWRSAALGLMSTDEARAISRKNENIRSN